MVQGIKRGQAGRPFSRSSPSVQLAGIIALLGAIGGVVLVGSVGEIKDFPKLGGFVLGCLFGSRVARLVSGNLAVFLHELKHAVVCNLVGNKSRGMSYSENEGAFEYEYPPEKRSFNLLIVTAPYWLPLFAVPLLLLLPAFGLFPGSRGYSLLVGLGYGLDRGLGRSDIHPNQTDLICVPGGYPAAVLYVSCLDLLMISILMPICVLDWTRVGRLMEMIVPLSN